MLRWVIQSNLGHNDDVATLVAALDALGVAHEPLKVIPFDDTPPAVSTDGAVLFYGSTTLMKNVAAAGRWRPGVFFDAARFAFDALRAGYGDALLNAESELVTIGAFVNRDLDPDTEVFLRPADDLKSFSGAVYTFGELARWREALPQSRGPLQPDTVVQVATPQTLGREWRCVVVEGRVITASQYRSSGRARMRPEVPDAVIAYANSMAARYAPARVFMLDVCETEAGLRVVETNCFNSAGFYCCDLYEVARTVSALAF